MLSRSSSRPWPRRDACATWNGPARPSFLCVSATEPHAQGPKTVALATVRPASAAMPCVGARGRAASAPKTVARSSVSRTGAASLRVRRSRAVPAMALPAVAPARVVASAAPATVCAAGPVASRPRGPVPAPATVARARARRASALLRRPSVAPPERPAPAIRTAARAGAPHSARAVSLACCSMVAGWRGRPAAMARTVARGCVSLRLQARRPARRCPPAKSPANGVRTRRPAVPARVESTVAARAPAVVLPRTSVASRTTTVARASAERSRKVCSVVTTNLAASPPGRRARNRTSVATARPAVA